MYACAAAKSISIILTTRLQVLHQISPTNQPLASQRRRQLGQRILGRSTMRAKINFFREDTRKKFQAGGEKGGHCGVARSLLGNQRAAVPALGCRFLNALGAMRAGFKPESIKDQERNSCDQDNVYKPFHDSPPSKFSPSTPLRAEQAASLYIAASPGPLL